MQAWDIEFKDLTVGYGSHIVLHDVNAVLPGGKVSVILGGSGCGKSTLLRHIIGLSRPLSGHVLVGGRDLFALGRADFRRIRRHMGVLFQDGALLVLRMVGLDEFADFYPNQLSGGMRKRAGLARAIVAEPRVLLCDEPTSGLDPITAARMDDLLLAMREQYAGMSVVVVSHDLASLRAIADHVLVLADGKALFSGTLAELEASDDPYLRQFLHREAGDERRDLHQPIDPAVSKALDNWLAS